LPIFFLTAKIDFFLFRLTKIYA